MTGPRGLGYAARRLLQAVPTVLVIVALNFMLLQLAPGDAADVLAGEAGAATPEYMAQLRQTFGLDQPVWLQLLHYVQRAATFDLGFSFRHNLPVSTLILDRLGPTLLLMLTVLVSAVGFGVLLGSLAARNLNRWQDQIISMLTVLAYATPVFWAGLMLIVVFAIRLGWFPTSGMQEVAAFHEGMAKVRDIAHHLVLPAVTLTMFYLALYTRLMRAAVLEQFSMDYVITARAKGLTEQQIARRHVLRNAVLPVLTMAGIQVGALLGGAVVVETVCLARSGSAGLRVAVRARPQPAAGHLLRLHLPGGGGQPAGRHRLRAAGPAHRAALSTPAPEIRITSA